LDNNYQVFIDANIFVAAVNYLVVKKNKNGRLHGCITLQNVSILYGRVWQSVRMLMHKSYYEITSSPNFEEGIIDKLFKFTQHTDIYVALLN